MSEGSTDSPSSGSSPSTGDGGGTAAVRRLLEDELAPDLEVVRLLDRGTTATIYLAREPALKRLVAVKVLSAELAGDDVARSRFEREARSAASIAHPSVVTIHRVGTLSSGQPYQVMEYVKGRSLGERLEAVGEISVAEGCRILRSLASALEAAHARHVVHRDVRPDNVLYEEGTGRVLLADFGIAAVLASGSEAVERLTRTGELLGDMSYASPEQLRGEEPSAETDVYALAMLGYELFARRGPYDAEASRELAVAHLREEPRRLAELRPDVPAGLDEILWSCLAKNPRHRPTAGQVAERMARIPEEGRRGSPPVGEGSAEPTRREAPRNPRSGPPERPAGTVAGKPPEEAPSGIIGLYRELKRRHVFRVALVYGAVAWGIVQVSSVTFPHLELPEWTITLVIVLAIMGFPIVLVVAWAFEMTPEGVRRTPRREDEDAGP